MCISRSSKGLPAVAQAPHRQVAHLWVIIAAGTGISSLESGSQRRLVLLLLVLLLLTLVVHDSRHHVHITAGALRRADTIAVAIAMDIHTAIYIISVYKCSGKGKIGTYESLRRPLLILLPGAAALRRLLPALFSS